MNGKSPKRMITLLGGPEQLAEDTGLPLATILNFYKNRRTPSAFPELLLKVLLAAQDLGIKEELIRKAGEYKTTKRRVNKYQWVLVD